MLLVGTKHDLIIDNITFREIICGYELKFSYSRQFRVESFFFIKGTNQFSKTQPINVYEKHMRDFYHMVHLYNI